MIRIMLLFGVSLTSGCAPQVDPAAPRVRDNDERVVTPPVNAFDLDQGYLRLLSEKQIKDA